MKNRPSVRSVVFEVTSKCNLKCAYCYNIHKVEGAPPPAKEGYRNAKKTLKKLFDSVELKQVTMSGGEPFLSERFSELVLFCRMRKKNVAVITNGQLLDEENLRPLLEMGVKTFEIPLHSPTPDAHDEMTGVPGSHEKALNALERVKNLGGTAVPVVVITRINYSTVGETLHRIKSLGLRRVMLNRFNIGGQGIASHKTVALTHEQLRSAFSAAEDAVEKLGLKATSNVCSPKCVLDPADYPHIGFAVCTPEVARRPLTLDPAGNVRYCNHSPIIIGNIHKSDWNEIVHSDYAKRWETDKPKICETCDLWTQCYGGCRAASEQIGGTLRDADPILRQ